MKIGVLGVGTITSAVIHGFIKAKIIGKGRLIEQISLSPRNSSKADKLVEASGASGEVLKANNNQEVIDSSDFLIIGVHHKQLKEIFQNLQFKKEMTIISITAVITKEELFQATKKVIPLENIYRLCTIPAAKNLKTSSVLFPPNKKIHQLFSTLGFCLECDKEEQLSAATAPMCLMGDFYNRCRILKDWLETKGIRKRDASKYISNVMAAILNDALERADKEDIFESLIEEQTPGGLNERIMKGFEANGIYKQLEKVLDEF